MNLAPEPLTCVALGAGKYLEEIDNLSIGHVCIHENAEKNFGKESRWMVGLADFLRFLVSSFFSWSPFFSLPGH